MDTAIIVFSFIGIISFAMSGALKGIKHDMDLVGVIMLGLITSFGGGVFRDIIIGKFPPTVFSDPLYIIYVIIAVIMTLIVFSASYILNDKFPKKFLRVESFLLLVTDTLGLGVFTVVGVETVFASGFDNVLLLLFAGVITGTGGGLISDICAGTIPNIFRKHIYALASFAGAVVELILRNYDAPIAMLCGFSVVFAIRMLAATFKWDMPRVKR